MNTILIGVISGIISSSIFYIYLLLLRPNIEIASDICNQTGEVGGFFGFKIVNNSIFFDLVDIEAEIVLKTPFNTTGGQNYKFQTIRLNKDKIKVLPKRSKKNHEQGGSYALILCTTENILNLWTTEHQHIELHVFARHSFSGSCKNFTKKYFTTANIKKGMFKFGKDLEIS